MSYVRLWANDGHSSVQNIRDCPRISSVTVRLMIGRGTMMSKENVHTQKMRMRTKVVVLSLLMATGWRMARHLSRLIAVMVKVLADTAIPRKRENMTIIIIQKHELTNVMNAMALNAYTVMTHNVCEISRRE